MQPPRSISTLKGSHSVIVYAAAMSVHGTFWDEPIRTDDELRDIPQRGLYTVRVELEGARWADELNLPEVRRKVLRGLLVSHTAGIDDGFVAQWVAPLSPPVTRTSAGWKPKRGDVGGSRVRFGSHRTAS